MKLRQIAGDNNLARPAETHLINFFSALLRLLPFIVLDRVVYTTALPHISKTRMGCEFWRLHWPQGTLIIPYDSRWNGVTKLLRDLPNGALFFFREALGRETERAT